MGTVVSAQVPVLSRHLGLVSGGMETGMPHRPDELGLAAALRQQMRLLNGRLRSAEQEIRRLQQLVDEDALTGLGNRRAFNGALSRLLSSAARSGRAACVIYLDLNGMKIVNDTFGHEAGDGLLKHVAECLHNHIRKGDFIARLGGDEFAILLPDTEFAGAKDKIAHLEGVLEDTPFLWNDVMIEVSAAFGVHRLEGGESAAEALAAADKAMYRAKRARRTSKRQA